MKEIIDNSGSGGGGGGGDTPGETHDVTYAELVDLKARGGLTITSTTPSTAATFVNFLDGTRGTAANPIAITLPAVDTRYCTFVGRTSNGDIKIWVPADEATGGGGNEPLG